MRTGSLATRLSIWMVGILLLPVAFSQTETAAINGFVTDSSGGVVPAADVVATNVATNAAYPVQTSEAGYYVITPLPIGTYTITVEVPGFKTGVAENITLQVQQRAKIDFSLEVGELTEVVTVESAAPLLTTEETSLG